VHQFYQPLIAPAAFVVVVTSNVAAPDINLEVSHTHTHFTKKKKNESDAIRSPWRLSTAAVWTCDEDALEWTSNMAAFFNSVGVEGMQQGFNMEGNTLGGGDSNCFLSTGATAMVPAQDSSVVNTWWSATTTNDAGNGIYFCGKQAPP
jgi:hypothetical protein